jgi:hypothetical protein
MEDNISKQLINRIINKLSGVKPFIKIVSMVDNISLISENKNIKFKKSNISISVNEMEFELDNYNLVIYLLDQIILDLTCNVNIKNYYVIHEDIEEDISKIIDKLPNVEWYISYDTHLEYLEMVDPIYSQTEMLSLIINNKKINTIESSFPKSVIFGSEYPVILNIDLLTVNEIKDQNLKMINIPYYYVDDYHAIRLITNENKRKIILRSKKMKKLK